MEVTAEELVRHYRSLSDEELLGVDPAELTDVARKYYRREFDRRDLARAPEPESAPAPQILGREPDWADRAAEVCSFTEFPSVPAAVEAEEARDILLAAGIPCSLSVVPADSDDDDAPRFNRYCVLVPDYFQMKAVSLLDVAIFNPEFEAEWRTHFERLSDDELREIAPDDIAAGLRDRADRLVRVYHEEVRRRREPGERSA